MQCLQEYDFTSGHIPGKENNIPDILSLSTAEEELLSFAFAVNSIETENDPTALHNAQKEDTTINEVIKGLLA